jgi:hypothetical protein
VEVKVQSGTAFKISCIVKDAIVCVRLDIARQMTKWNKAKRRTLKGVGENGTGVKLSLTPAETAGSNKGKREDANGNKKQNRIWAESAELLCNIDLP